MHITIFGGTGFVGKHITRAAINAGHKVTALGRNINVYDPTTYNGVLKQSDAVIHCIGTFFPSSSYKELIGEPLTPCSGLALVKARLEGGNPMSGGFTKLNTTSAEILAKAASLMTPQGTPFIYISAEASPLSSDGYIESKRRAEQLVAANKSLRTVFLRPGIIHDPHAVSKFPPSPRDIVGAVLAGWDAVKGDAPRTSVDTLARACVDACTDSEISGVVSNAALKQFEAFSKEARADF